MAALHSHCSAHDSFTLPDLDSWFFLPHHQHPSRRSQIVEEPVRSQPYLSTADSVLSKSVKGARAAQSWDVHSVLNPAFDKEHMLYYVQVGTLAVASMSQKAIACTIAQRLPPLSIS